MSFLEEVLVMERMQIIISKYHKNDMFSLRLLSFTIWHGVGWATQEFQNASML
jgi:hypothetical protein